MSYADIRAELLSQKKLFVDPDFPPNLNSLYVNGVAPVNKPGVVQWKRPWDLVKNPKFIVGNASRFDLDQGQLGNCWFVAGAATLASSHRIQFFRVVPQDQYFDRDYAGLVDKHGQFTLAQTASRIFHFNFWWYGSWTEVIVDDFLPCDRWGLLYCRNREEPAEFWSALLEKAYAKLYGSYGALDGGKLQDSLVDFTGGISEVIPLEDKSTIPLHLYDLMVKTSTMNSMIGAAIYLPPNATSTREVRKANGLYMGHAYSVTGFATIIHRSETIKLLRLRNPWGKDEWNGSWSDRSREMRSLTEEQKKQLNIVIIDDGEFWISQFDFFQNFDEIDICHLQPDSMTQEVAIDMHRQQWAVAVYHDAWIRGVTAGGCGNPPYQRLYWSNPQFHVTLADHDNDSRTGECTLVVSLLEKQYDSSKKIAIGYDIYRLQSGHPELIDGEKVDRRALRLAQRSGNFRFDREVTNRFTLPPGVYVIIPSTFHPNKEAKFMLRLFTEKKASSGLIDIPTGPEEEIKPLLDPIQEIFDKHAGNDRKVDAEELRRLLNEAFDTNGRKMSFALETCRCIMVMMDRDKSGFLGINEVREMMKQLKTYKEVFQRFDRDRSGKVDSFELTAMFQTMGFPVSRMVLTSIVRRYGGRHNKITEEDFIMVMCKLTTMYHIYIDHGRKIGVSNGATPFTLDEWLQNTMFC